jgi:dGTPase
MSETNTLPDEWQFHHRQPLATLSDTATARIIADYIASMTDRHAALEHERLFDLGPILR